MRVTFKSKQQQQPEVVEEKQSSRAGPMMDINIGHKPWLESKQRRKADRKVAWTFCTLALFFGIGSVAALMVSAYFSVPKSHNYCMVLDEQFDGTNIDPTVWTHEIQTGGWGTGEFEWTTDSTNNSFVKDGSLYIVPTLTSDALGDDAIINGYSLNLTSSNQCTSSNKSDFYCAVASNSSTGTILPPVQSARLTTKINNKVIKFGKIEVTAKMPTGDWIWPAVWMMPSQEVYGPWPQSGEIDIFESKGNPSQSRTDTLSSSMQSTLHWGPLPAFDSYKLTHSTFNLFRNFWNQKKHTFGMVWDENGITTWETTRAYGVLKTKFGPQTFWEKGNYPPSLANGTILNDPWTIAAGANVLNAAPFDQDFYLILSVAVGSTNGYFTAEDAPDGLPWTESNQNAARDFWASRNQWLPTWPTKVEDRAMVVDSVKMWQQC